MCVCVCVYACVFRHACALHLWVCFLFFLLLSCSRFASLLAHHSTGFVFCWVLPFPSPCLGGGVCVCACGVDFVAVVIVAVTDGRVCASPLFTYPHDWGRSGCCCPSHASSSPARFFRFVFLKPSSLSLDLDSSSLRFSPRCLFTRCHDPLLRPSLSPLLLFLSVLVRCLCLHVCVGVCSSILRLSELPFPAFRSHCIAKIYHYYFVYCTALSRPLLLLCVSLSGFLFFVLPCVLYFCFSVSMLVSLTDSHACTLSASRSCLLISDRQACFSVPPVLYLFVCTCVYGGWPAR